MEVTKETTIIEKNGKTVTETITRISQRFKQAPKSIRYGIIGYTAIGFVSKFLYTYYSGKYRLLQYRHECREIKKNIIFENELRAIKRGISQDSFSNTWKSVFWPLHIADTIMVSIVVALNHRGNKQ